MFLRQFIGLQRDLLLERSRRSSYIEVLGQVLNIFYLKSVLKLSSVGAALPRHRHWFSECGNFYVLLRTF
ncbi:hypothetical protein C4Q31_00610 [Leptospira borgpetersenii serovar Ceylonica]|uniref:PF07599 family protein n=1 Tax=Leptospira borgpetersenii str. 200801926 TaxID=1193009 RepID=A0ABN0HX86_LEPBO|nr:hypothetical protein C4Q31_00610 [Leptospira borgpetersenii serovar Ceylonica]EKP13418.1 hypothetical protein LEP1GSC128_3521 [Leptospira borgpetersenii str. 200801926]EKQ92003.1 hypothetical protein LEP1GSC101_2970 [Leptospira borgpetersenii str. UI 09149]EKR01722.1 hypothetical protein LEP1GSC121_0402 [Leptospira borgpetersenii serovar Castellonis str. 200801910]OOV44644.1 hypothetical protein B1H38_08365 [Leptospira borgpetersenii serovar Ballum]